MNKIITLILFVFFLAKLSNAQVDIDDDAWDNIEVKQMQNEKINDPKQKITKQLRAFRIKIEGDKDFNIAINKFSLMGVNTSLYYNSPKTINNEYDGIIVFLIEGKETVDQFLYYDHGYGAGKIGYEIYELQDIKIDKLKNEFKLVCLEYKYNYVTSDSLGSINNEIISLDLSKFKDLLDTYLYKEIEGIQAYLNKDYKIAYEMFYQSHKMGNNLKGFKKIFKEAGEKIKDICKSEFDKRYELCKDNYKNDKYREFIETYDEIIKEMEYMKSMEVDCYSQDLKYNDELKYMYAYSLSEVHTDGSMNNKIQDILNNFKKEYSYYYKSLNLLGSIYFKDRNFEKAKDTFYKVLADCKDKDVKTNAENFIEAINKINSK